MPFNFTYTNADVEITKNRLARFEAFRSKLTETGKAEIDRMLSEWCELVREKAMRDYGAKKIFFGTQSAQELFISLVEFTGAELP